MFLIVETFLKKTLEISFYARVSWDENTNLSIAANKKMTHTLRANRHSLKLTLSTQASILHIHRKTGSREHEFCSVLFSGTAVISKWGLDRGQQAFWPYRHWGAITGTQLELQMTAAEVNNGVWSISKESPFCGLSVLLKALISRSLPQYYYSPVQHKTHYQSLGPLNQDQKDPLKSPPPTLLRNILPKILLKSFGNKC